MLTFDSMPWAAFRPLNLQQNHFKTGYWRCYDSSSNKFYPLFVVSSQISGVSQKKAGSQSTGWAYFIVFAGKPLSEENFWRLPWFSCSKNGAGRTQNDSLTSFLQMGLLSCDYVGSYEQGKSQSEKTSRGVDSKIRSRSSMILDMGIYWRSKTK